MPGNYRHELSQELARAADVAVEDAVSVLVFRIASEWFALRSLVFQEIALYQKAYVLPFRSGALLAGLVNVNGELLLCVSLAAALGISGVENAMPGGRPRLCVVRTGREQVAFAVDESGRAANFRQPNATRPGDAGQISFRTSRFLFPSRRPQCRVD